MLPWLSDIWMPSKNKVAPDVRSALRSIARQIQGKKEYNGHVAKGDGSIYMMKLSLKEKSEN